jgi:hypothetical protein
MKIRQTIPETNKSMYEAIFACHTDFLITETSASLQIFEVILCSIQYDIKKDAINIIVRDMQIPSISIFVGCSCGADQAGSQKYKNCICFFHSTLKKSSELFNKVLYKNCIMSIIIHVIGKPISVEHTFDIAVAFRTFSFGKDCKYLFIIMNSTNITGIRSKIMKGSNNIIVGTPTSA